MAAAPGPPAHGFDLSVDVRSTLRPKTVDESSPPQAEPRPAWPGPLRQGAEPNATFGVGADSEPGDCKGLTLSNSSPVLFRKLGLFFESRLRRIGVEKDGHEHNENSLHFPRRYVDP